LTRFSSWGRILFRRGFFPTAAFFFGAASFLSGRPFRYSLPSPPPSSFTVFFATTFLAGRLWRHLLAGVGSRGVVVVAAEGLGDGGVGAELGAAPTQNSILPFSLVRWPACHLSSSLRTWKALLILGVLGNVMAPAVFLEDGDDIHRKGNGNRARAGTFQDHQVIVRWPGWPWFPVV